MDPIPTPPLQESILTTTYTELGLSMLGVLREATKTRSFGDEPLIELDPNEWESQIAEAKLFLGLGKHENPLVPRLKTDIFELWGVLDMLERSLKPEQVFHNYILINQGTVAELGIRADISYLDPRVARENFLKGHEEDDLDKMVSMFIERLLRVSNSDSGPQRFLGFGLANFSDSEIETDDYGKLASSLVLSMLINELARLNEVSFFRTKNYPQQEKDKEGDEFNWTLTYLKRTAVLASMRVWQILDPVPMADDSFQS